MGHWEDLMDLDSDPYLTPNSTINNASPSSNTSWSEAQPVSQGLIPESTNQGSIAASEVALAWDAEVPDVEGDSNDVKGEPELDLAARSMGEESNTDAAAATEQALTSDAEVLENEGDNDDVGSEAEIAAADSGPRIPKLSERRKAQKCKFTSWLVYKSVTVYEMPLIDVRLAKRAETITKEQVRKVVEKTEDVYLSTRNLIAKQESNRIVAQPRDYQQELCERAKKQNIIAVLDTGIWPEPVVLASAEFRIGSGKTLIAVLLLQHIIDQELEDRAVGKPPKIAFFLVRYKCQSELCTAKEASG